MQERLQDDGERKILQRGRCSVMVYLIILIRLIMAVSISRISMTD